MHSIPQKLKNNTLFLKISVSSINQTNKLKFSQNYISWIKTIPQIRENCKIFIKLFFFNVFL